MEMQLDPIGQLDPYVIAATLAIVLITYVLLRRWLFTPYIAVLDERQARIDAGNERMAEADAVAKQAVWDVASIEADARAKAAVIEHDSLEETEAHRKRTMDAAIHEVDQMLAKGRAEIAKDRESETARVRAEALTCVDTACSQLFGKSDPMIVESSVDRAIDRLS
jgi:F-type H+-transporting ATPase subunit b